jgi:hypothetical protein
MFDSISSKLLFDYNFFNNYLTEYKKGEIY